MVGNVLSLAVNDGPAVAIDLRGVPQGDYYGLVQGDWVVVLGQLSPDYRRVLGTSITRYAGSQHRRATALELGYDWPSFRAP